MTEFALHPDFAGSSHPLADLPLSTVRLQDDARFLWVILVPRRAGAVEIDDLLPAERAELLSEAIEAARRVRAICEALGRPVEKINTAALGNITRQLHLHVIGRRSDDAAWPRPVWGVGEAEPWSSEDLGKIAALWERSA